jgi:enoyl-CoA hydratase/carnithine racemase
MALVLTERRDDGIALLTLDDPDRRNAMTVAMGEALEAALAELGADRSLRVVVITGTPPAFSAGGDLAMLEELARKTREEGFDATREMRAFYNRFLGIRTLPVPVIAAINGHAVGAGLCVALAADLRIVADDAKLGLNFARLGLHPGMAGSWLLPRVVGEQRAAELLYTGRLGRGAELASYGLALASLPAEQVLPRALALAEDIALSAPIVVRQLKRSLTAAADNTIGRQLDLEAALQAIDYGTDDLVEGLAAGRERRTPRFTGV